MESQPTKSDNEGSQRRPRVKYGSLPPKCFNSDAELSQWLLEAEQEDIRLATIELEKERRIAAEKSGLGPSTDKEPAPAVHRGCKYQLPSADPIAIPTVPYDPSDIRWSQQVSRRRQALKAEFAPIKCSKVIYKMVEIVFAFGFQDNVEFDSYDNIFSEKDVKPCPICSRPPEAVNQEIKIAVNRVTEVSIDQVTEVSIDQVTEVSIDQVTEVAVDQEIEIGVDAVAIITSTNPATQDTQAQLLQLKGQTRPTGRTE